MAKKGVPTNTKKSRRDMVTPVNVIKLMDKQNGIGGTRAAQALGVSTTLLYKAKAEGAVNRVVEMAAASALQNFGKSLQPPMPEKPEPREALDHAPRSGEMTFFVTIPSAKANMFHRMVSGMGGVLVAA